MPQRALGGLDARAGDVIALRHTPNGFELSKVDPDAVLDAGTGFALALQEMVNDRLDEAEPVLFD